jgi:hypothetical protein
MGISILDQQDIKDHQTKNFDPAKSATIPFTIELFFVFPFVFPFVLIIFCDRSFVIVSFIPLVLGIQDYLAWVVTLVILLCVTCGNIVRWRLRHVVLALLSQRVLSSFYLPLEVSLREESSHHALHLDYLLHLGFVQSVKHYGIFSA